MRPELSRYVAVLVMMQQFPDADWPAIPDNLLEPLREGMSLTAREDITNELKTFLRELEHRVIWCQEYANKTDAQFVADHANDGAAGDAPAITENEMTVMSFTGCEEHQARIALQMCDDNTQYAVNWWFTHGPMGDNDWGAYAAQQAGQGDAGPEPGEEPVPTTPAYPGGLPADASKQSALTAADRQTNVRRDVLSPMKMDGAVLEDNLQRPHQVTDFSCTARLVAPMDGQMVMGAADVDSFALIPLQVIDGFEDFFERTANAAEDSPTALPFDVSSHSNAQVDVSKQFLKRTNEDMQRYSDSQQGAMTTWVKQLTAEAAARFVQVGAQDPDFDAVQARLQQLLERLQQLQAHDENWMMEATETVLAQMEYADPTQAADATTCHGFRLARKCKQHEDPGIAFGIRTLLSTKGAEDLLAANPYIQDAETMLKLLFATQLYAMRVIHANRCIDQVIKLQKSLRTLVTSSSSDVALATHKLSQASSGLAGLMHAKRYSMQKADGVLSAYEYDPRFLVFEYLFQYMLRKRQVEMTKDYLAEYHLGQSSCKQMIMGAGKTTVIGPLLSLCLADSKRLVMLTCPPNLLEMARNRLREVFSSVMPKKIFTLEFQRNFDDDPNIILDIIRKLNDAVTHRGIVCAKPEVIKSTLLKMVELLHVIEQTDMDKFRDVAGESKAVGGEKEEIRYRMGLRSDMSDMCIPMLNLFKNGSLIMDEVSL